MWQLVKNISSSSSSNFFRTNLSQLDISCRQVNFVALETPHDKLNVAAVVYPINTVGCALNYSFIDQPTYLARLTLERSGNGVIWY